MKLELIIEEWTKDCKIDDTDLSRESLKIPSLHAKYYDWYNKENLLLTKTEHDFYRLKKIKNDYYSGRMSQEELTEYGWDQFELRIMKDDLDLYIKSDKDLQTVLLKLQLQKEKVDTLKDIIKSLHERGFLIKNSVEIMKYLSGF